MYLDYLAHYGVKGMKWGVRKSKKEIKKFNRFSAKLSRDEARLYRAKKALREDPESGNQVVRVNNNKSTTVKKLIEEGYETLLKQAKERNDMANTLFENIPDKYTLVGAYSISSIFDDGTVAAYPMFNLAKR